jgi:hypothetical protein
VDHRHHLVDHAQVELMNPLDRPPDRVGNILPIGRLSTITTLAPRAAMVAAALPDAATTRSPARSIPSAVR